MGIPFCLEVVGIQVRLVQLCVLRPKIVRVDRSGMAIKLTWSDCKRSSGEQEQNSDTF